MSDSQRPPANPEIEEALLGSLLHDPAQAEMALGGSLNEKDFYLYKHQLIYWAIRGTHPHSDPLTVAQRLEQHGKLEAVGGTDYLQYLAASVPNAEYAPAYLKVVQDLSTRRKLITAAQQMLEGAYSGEVEADQLLSDSLRQVDQASPLSQHQVLSLYDAAQRQLDRVEKAQLMREAGKSLVVPTGLPDLDFLLGGGFSPGELGIIVSRAGIGKSLLLGGVVDAAEQAGHAGLIFEMEMPGEQLAKRFLHPAVPGSKQKQGTLDQDDWNAIAALAQSFQGRRIYIDDSGFQTPQTISARARQVVRDHGVELIVVDYLQMMSSGSNNTRINEAEETALKSKALKGLARDLNVVVLAASAVNRRDGQVSARHTRGGEMPVHDADVLMALNEQDEIMPNTTFDKAVTLTVDKARDGMTGEVNLVMVKKELRFRPGAPLKGSPQADAPAWQDL